MLTGVNIEATVELARQLTVPIIASGGITDLDDVKALCKVESEGIIGAITGRAVYQGTLDFAAAQKLADKLSTREKEGVTRIQDRDKAGSESFSFTIPHFSFPQC